MEKDKCENQSERYLSADSGCIREPALGAVIPNGYFSDGNQRVLRHFADRSVGLAHGRSNRRREVQCERDIGFPAAVRPKPEIERASAPFEPSSLRL